MYTTPPFHNKRTQDGRKKNPKPKSPLSEKMHPNLHPQLHMRVSTSSKWSFKFNRKAQAPEEEREKNERFVYLRTEENDHIRICYIAWDGAFGAGKRRRKKGVESFSLLVRVEKVRPPRDKARNG
jgi:hypothetical protein